MPTNLISSMLSNCMFIRNLYQTTFLGTPDTYHPGHLPSRTLTIRGHLPSRSITIPHTYRMDTYPTDIYHPEHIPSGTFTITDTKSEFPEHAAISVCSVWYPTIHFFSPKFAIFSNHFSTPSQFFQHFTFLFHIRVYTHRRVIHRRGGGMGRGMNERAWGVTSSYFFTVTELFMN